MSTAWANRVTSETFNPRDVSLGELTQNESFQFAQALRDKASLQNGKRESIFTFLDPSSSKASPARDLVDLIGAIAHLNPKNITGLSGYGHEALQAMIENDPTLPATLNRGWEIIDAAKDMGDATTAEAAQSVESLLSTILQKTRTASTEVAAR